MKEIIEKISSYNIFNYLFPGAIYVIIVKMISSYNLVQKDIFIGIFLYYFIGLVISRVGSIIIEPLFKFLKIITYISYDKYVKAAQMDSKIELFSEINNMYRTLCSVFLCILITKIFELIPEKITVCSFSLNKQYLAFVVIAILFIFAYKKQTAYIVGRVKQHVEE